MSHLPGITTDSMILLLHDGEEAQYVFTGASVGLGIFSQPEFVGITKDQEKKD